MFFCNFLAAGPTVAIVEITIDFFGTSPPGPTTPLKLAGPMTAAFDSSIAKVAYFFTTTALMQGMSNLFWMPVIVKYGRRPAYLISFTIYTVTAIWAGVSKSYGSELASRIIMGLASGCGECVAPITIADIFFLHERGTVMACYTAALSCGVSGGIIIAGLITIAHPWRTIYYVATALIGFLTLLVFFTMPETSFNRSPVEVPTDLHKPSELYTHEGQLEAKPKTDIAQISNIEAGSNVQHKKRSYVQNLRFFSGTLTKESILKIFLRPIALLALPPVLWATLCMSVTIGFLVAISSNFASAFQTTYDFQPWQSGLCFLSGLIGSLIGILGGGHFSDLVANWLTHRNGGIREPEMRLPAVTLGLIISPLGLVLYGVGIANKLHWMVPTLGLGCCMSNLTSSTQREYANRLAVSFAIAQATNVTLVYTIDAYRPVAGEIVVTQLAFKGTNTLPISPVFNLKTDFDFPAAFGFLLSFYTNPWIAEAGYARAFGAMAGISGAVLLFWIFFYLFGKKIRHSTFKWSVIKSIQWNIDREVGE